MGSVINFDLISHPANWIIIFLTLYLLVLLAKILHDAANSGVTPFNFGSDNK
jgi:CDP-diglyceride synthetase